MKGKVLILGGTGIISTDVTKFAVKADYDVSILNRRIRCKEEIENVRFIKGDLRKDSIESLQKSLDEYWDVIIDFVSYTENELRKTLEVVKGKYRQYIFVSSATVCGKSEGRAIVESDIDEENLWSYVKDKLSAEKYLKGFHINSDKHYTIIRPYITYNEQRLPIQFSPLQYYTVINRCKCGKPLPVCNADCNTTITQAKDFAVGCVGLFLNVQAYEEAINIVSNNCITWDDLYNRIARALGVSITKIELDYKFIQSSRIKGFDKMEILYDKALDKQFDSSKIDMLVPEFKKSTNVSGISFNNITEFYEKHSEKRIINYTWDARIDNMISKWVRNGNIKVTKSKLSIWAYDLKSMTLKDIVYYILYRYDVTFFLCRGLSRVVRRLKWLPK